MKTPTTKPAGRIAADALSAEIPADVDIRTGEERAEDEKIAATNRDQAGAQFVQAPGDGEIVAGTVVMTPGPQPVLEGDEGDWEKVVVVAGGAERLPAHGSAKTIMAEARTQPDEKGNGAGRFNPEVSYSKNADAYVGHFERDESGKPNSLFSDVTGPVFLIGGNVRQFGFGGVSRQAGYLSVGPGSSIVAAVNLALQKGAKEVTVHGMSDHDKAIVGPWLDKIAGEFDTLDYGQSKD